MMIRLGLRLSLRAGREALVRLLLIATAVAVGVTVLLSVAADFRAYTATTNRQCWECTTGTSGGKSAATDVDVWNHSKDYYLGRTIERLDVAAIGPKAPDLPGLSRMPDAGRYYVSPALDALLKSAPHDQLGDRFPGTRAGLLGDAALSGPDELVIVVGRTPADLIALPGTTVVDRISTRSAVDVTAVGYRYGFGLVAIALFVPLLTLIGVATRLAAARREERYAAMRLIGATSRQINAIASVDAFVGSLIGAVAGVGGFLIVRPAIARTAVTGARYFPSLVTPTGLGYAVVIAGVPVAAALGALWSLRRVRIDPMGVGRKTTPKPPRVWGPVVLVAGMVLFNLPRHSEGDFAVIYLGLLLTMVGLVASGPWMTARIAASASRSARGPSTLLAARRLADDPRSAARSVSGLVLAVFIGTTIAGIVPPLISSQNHVGGGTLTNTLRSAFASPSAQGLEPADAAVLLSKLRNYPDVAVLPLYEYAIPDPAPAFGQGQGQGEGQGPLPMSYVAPCESLKQFPAFGACPAGAVDVKADFGRLLTIDNLLAVKAGSTVVGPDSRTGSIDLSTLRLGGVFVRTPDAAAVERIRTLLAATTAKTGSAGSQTFGEVAQSRAVLYEELRNGALAVVVVTLLVAGCSLAVAVAGGVLERKRPFTLLRLTGTPTTALYRVALLESAVPLTAAALPAGVVGILAAIPVIRQLSPGASTAMPDHVYFLTIGAGLAASLAAVLAALPLLRRVTDPDDAHFE